jgi:nucleoside 2-deoxyribosyltransferase
MIYLASPYSHPDPRVREHRFRAACQAAASMPCDGSIVFSPIVHSHPLVAFGLPTAWSAWERIDRAYLERCDEVVVLMLDGWEASVGVRAEIDIARALGKPVRFLAPADATGWPTLAHDASGGRELKTTTNEKRPPRGGLVGEGRRSDVR